MRTYHYVERDEKGVATLDEQRPVTVRLQPGYPVETSRIRLAVESGGRKDRDALAALARTYKLEWLAGAQQWETRGAWSDPETHRKLRTVLEADGFTVLDDFGAYKGDEGGAQ